MIDFKIVAGPIPNLTSSVSRSGVTSMLRSLRSGEHVRVEVPDKVAAERLRSSLITASRNAGVKTITRVRPSNGVFEVLCALKEAQ